MEAHALRRSARRTIDIQHTRRMSRGSPKASAEVATTKDSRRTA